MTIYQSAALQTHRERLRQENIRSQRDRALRPVRLIDHLISRLEELHLEGRKRVPASFDATLALLNDALPEDLRQELRSRVTIAHLMDRLYTIQDQLFARLVSRDHGDDDDPRDGDAQGDLREAS